MVWENQKSGQTNLNESFLTLYSKARLLIGKIWSLVEIGFLESDAAWLCQWLESHSSEIKSYLLDPDPTSSKYLGTLLLVLSSEIGREKGSEEELWCHVKECISNQNGIRQILFPQGQPSNLCKKAICLAGELFGSMGMRHLFEYENTQVYFDSVKIQYGFSRRGMKNRLPYWLLNCGVPLAVRALLGDHPYQDLASQTFQEMWESLRRYRKSRISKNEIKSILQQSPWVKRDWIDEILEQTKARLDLGEEPTETYNSPIEITKPLSVFAGVRLVWCNSGTPRLRLIINEQYIKNYLTEEERNDLVFFVDGKRVSQWNYQGNGNWASSKEIPCEPDSQSKHPNHTPLLLQIRCGEKILPDFDLQEEGSLGSDVLLFEGDSGNFLPDQTPMYCRRRYFILYDAELTAYLALNEIRIGNRKACCLPEGWSEDFVIKLGDLIYWQPRLENRVSQTRPNLVLKLINNSSCFLGESAILEIEGIPNDVTGVRLQIGGKIHSLFRKGENWCTDKKISITASLALRQERVRVRLITNTRNFAVAPRLELNLDGLTYMKESQSVGCPLEWREHSSNSELNKNNSSEYFWAFCGNQNLRNDLHEGFRSIQKAQKKVRVSFHDLAGWGEKFWINGDHSYVLAESVSDWGKGEFFIPPPAWSNGTFPKLILRFPMEISSEHQIIYIINLNNSPQPIQFPIGEKLDEEGREYKILFPQGISFHDDCLAIAFTYQGSRLASYWNTKKIIQSLTYCNVQHLKTLFALLRWCKAPILSTELIEIFEKAVHRRPIDFIQAWKFNEGLPVGLQLALDDLVDPLLRAALWNWIPDTTDKTIKFFKLFCPNLKRSGQKAIVSISDLCPSLLGRILPRISIRHPEDTYRNVKRELLSINDETTNLKQPHFNLMRRIRERFRISIGDLTEILGIFQQFTFKHRCLSKEEYSLLRRMAESVEGRICLSVHILDALIRHEC